jgi:predicted O-methyltransferase YrrM
MNIQKNTDYNFMNKIINFIYNHEKNKNNLSILEFGVREGRSTKMFLDICKKNNGKLISIDINDYSNLFSDFNWTFIKSKDDNINYISKFFINAFDIILIDSLHEPNHVKKLIYLYWEHLKINGSMYIDDISWLPYIKNGWNDHEFTEKINYDTFHILLKILLNNSNNFILEFNFQDSGIARITKISSNPINELKHYNVRKNYIKNFIKKIIYIFKKNE